MHFGENRRVGCVLTAGGAFQIDPLPSLAGVGRDAGPCPKTAVAAATASAVRPTPRCYPKAHNQRAPSRANNFAVPVSIGKAFDPDFLDHYVLWLAADHNDRVARCRRATIARRPPRRCK